ncbi:hypothetical protein HDU76_008541 [Blyttiomyces sp. JEL0837]|nr:hypothetical protein HDU76_008541 [Blyttiomyces sp. JEL0837]
MMLFAETPDKFLSMYTAQFKADFLKILSRSHGTKRTHVNVVYQEYISDRNHIHMNATRWNSLSEFAKAMAREGLVEVDETEKGVFVRWIDNSPEALARQDAIAKKERLEKSEEERSAKLLAEQIGRAQAQSGQNDAEFTELKRENAEEPIKLKLDIKIAPAAKPAVDGAPNTTTAAATSTTTTEAAPKPAFGGGFSFKSAKPASALATTSSIISKKPAWASSSSASSSSSAAAPTASTTAGGSSSSPFAKSSAPAPAAGTGAVGGGKKLSNMELIMKQEMERKQKREGGGGGFLPPAKRVK